MRAIGVDVGTYNSAAAYLRGESVFVLRSRHGRTFQGEFFPSFAQYDASGRQVIQYGEVARRELATTPRQVVWGVKRLIGKSFQETEADRRRYRYLCTERAGQVVICVGDCEHSPVEVCSEILRWIRTDVSDAALNEQLGGEPATHAVVTYPAYFNALQLRETLKAAELAGFQEVRPLTEPAAAALAYGTRLDARRSPLLLTIDWGAGTLDLVVTNLVLDESGVPVLTQADAPYGDTQLGGIDMDDLLLEAIVDRYQLPEFAALMGGGEEAGDPVVERQFQEVRLQIERAKVRLSRERTREMVDVVVPGRAVSAQIARSAAHVPAGQQGEWIVLDEVIAPLLEEARGHILHSLRRLSLEPGDVDELLLVGGPMHMPCVRAMIGQVFWGNDDIQQQLQHIETNDFPVDPMEAVVRGAALAAAKLWGGVGDVAGIRVSPTSIAFDYGVMLSPGEGMRGQGEVLLRRNNVPPLEGKLGPVGNRGEPGDSVVVSLFQCRDDMGTEVYERLEDYRFHPAYDVSGGSLFEVELSMGKPHASDSVIVLVARDVRSGEEMVVEFRGQSGERMPRPLAPRSDIEAEAGLPAGQPTGARVDIMAPLAEIPAEVVASARRRATAFLQLADRKSQGRAKPPSVERCYQLLLAAVSRLPAGKARYQDWAPVHNRCEELRSALVLEGLVTREELAQLE